MLRRPLLRLCGAIVLGIAIFGLSNHRGSANVEPDDRKLEAFIEAASAVDGVMAAWQQKITNADDQHVEALRHQANIDIRKTIDDIAGMTLAEYQTIRREIAIDPEMRARVTELMQQRQERRDWLDVDKRTQRRAL